MRKSGKERRRDMRREGRERDGVSVSLREKMGSGEVERDREKRGIDRREGERWCQCFMGILDIK